MSERIDIELASLFDKRKNDGARDLRRAAWADFSRRGLPNKRVESWHYTDLRGALKALPEAATPAPSGIRPVVGHSLEECHFCLIDGRYVAANVSKGVPVYTNELPPGIEVQSLRDALALGDPVTTAALAPPCADEMVALNAALMQDGVIINIAAEASIGPPLRLSTLLAEESHAFTRSLVRVGRGACVTIIEDLKGLSIAGAIESHVLVLHIGVGARVTHVLHAGKSAERTSRIVSLLAQLDEGAALDSFALVEGGGLLRRQIFASLDGEHARVAFKGATLARGRDHVDVTLVVDHKMPHGQSRERFRHIVDQAATGVFQGKIIVRPGAQKTDGAMQSKAILLSDGATMNNKPELEIFADDVQCGHGATCGRLDKDQLFYLMARGLPREEAEALLIEGFANEAFEGLENEALRETLSKNISAWLSGRAA